MKQGLSTDRDFFYIFDSMICKGFFGQLMFWNNQRTLNWIFKNSYFS